ncbi:response regulator transcription factor [Labilibaculum euxinus]|uniref:Phosphate regulon transcriptional regulatory protein PhoB n=1 Tax=Labilibaculum euxinus TaxID=2686357 RepID=A0A7M4DAK5_9BACT|nr:response regulator transcription factor [Labilibaculum euxinus]MUP39684.1 response regulator [Labilibaculum euxinus]MVB08889.1 response regulator [Labilibaculum euxinus]
MKKEILIIEDDLSLQKILADYLSSCGFQCTCVELIKDGKSLFDKKFFHIVLLDLGLPDGDGLDCISFIKSIWSNTGVIIISARDKLEDRVDGLNLGADDYLVKPFHLSELNARINALVRRNFQAENQVLIFGELEIDTRSNQVKIRNEQVDFSRKEFDLLLYFIENKNRVLTKESLFEHVWGENPIFMDNSDFIYTHINRLRKKIKNHTGENYIKTVHGFGYKLDNH